MRKTTKFRNNERIGSLQGLRGIGFLCVCTGHCTLTKLGAFGVSLFFVLSGFLLTYRNAEDEIPCSLKSGIQFSINRIKRLYPLHILTMLSLVLYIKIMQNMIQWKMIVFNSFLIQSWIPDMSVYFSLNGVSWYLSACVFIYAVFPLMLSFIRRTSKHSIAFIFCIYLCQVLTGIGSILDPVQRLFDNPDMVHWITYICPLFRFGDFVIGGYLGYSFAHIRSETINKRIVSAAECITIIIFVLIQYMCEHNICIWQYEVFKNTLCYTPLAAAFVFLFATEKGMVSRFLTWHPLVSLGNISAYTFLIHYAVIPYLRTILVGVLGLTLDPWVLFLFTLGISCACAEIYIKLEKSVNCWISTTDQ